MDKRLQIDFSDKAYKDLESLQLRIDAPSKSEVIREALGVLRWLAEEVLGRNHRVLVEKPEEGVTREMVFHFLERSRPQETAQKKRRTSSQSRAAGAE
jgi:hypothetical protein